MMKYIPPAHDSLWRRIRPHVLLIACILLTSGCLRLAIGDDTVPTWAIRGIAAQETGTHYVDMGDIRGPYARSSNGAVSPWHISLDVLADLGLSAKASRIHRDPVYAESVARLWLTHLYSVTGDWSQAVAAWRAGLRNRHRSDAVEYAIRARNYGTTY
jgi:hypothetical protein